MGMLAAPRTALSGDDVTLAQHDGEIVIANAHLQARLGTLGGRVRSLTIRGLSGFDATAMQAPGASAGEMVGGLAGDTTAQIGFPGIFIGQDYRFQIIAHTPEEVVVRFAHEVIDGDLRGLVVQKDYRLDRSDRLLRVTVRLRNAREDGADERPIRLAYRSHNTFAADPGRDMLLLIPTRRGLMRRIDNENYLVSDLSAGWAAGVDPEGKRGLVCAFDLEQASSAFCWVGDLPTAEWIYREIALADGEEWSTEIRYIPFSGLGAVNVVSESLIGTLTIPAGRAARVVFDALGVRENSGRSSVTLQPVLVDSNQRELARLEARALTPAPGDPSHLEWNANGWPQHAHAVGLLMDGKPILAPGVVIEPPLNAERIYVPPMSSEFRDYVERLLIDAESRCAVPDRKAEWDSMLGLIAGWREWSMAGDLPRRWPPLRPLVESTQRRRGFRVEQVSAEFWPGVRYAMHVFVPDGTGPFPTVIVAATGADGGRSPVYQQLQAGLAQCGLLSASVVPLGKGARYTDRDAYGFNEIAMLVGTSVRQEQEHTATRALDYLLSRADVDPARIAITGDSDGGFTALLSATVDRRITAVAPACITWTFCKWLLPGVWKHMIDEESGVPGMLSAGANVPVLAAANAPKWQHFLYASEETNLLDQIPLIDGAARTAYAHAAATDCYSSGIADCKHGYWPEISAQFIGWVHEVFVGMPAASQMAAGPKPDGQQSHQQLLLIDGVPVDAAMPGSSAFDAMKFATLTEDGGQDAMLKIIEARRLDARSHRAAMLAQPDRMRAELKRCLGLEKLELSPSDNKEDNEDDCHVVQLVTEPGLHVRAEWVSGDTPDDDHVGAGKILLVVGSRADRQRFDTQPSAPRLDLYQREEDILGPDLTALVLLNRPPLGMWVWDAIRAARWLRQRRAGADIELVGVGEAGAIIASLAGLLSDDIDGVRLVRPVLRSLDDDIVGQHARQTPYWAFRLLWVTDLPEAAETLRRSGRLR